MEHEDFSGDISDDIEDFEHEHPLAIKYYGDIEGL